MDYKGDISTLTYKIGFIKFACMVQNLKISYSTCSGFVKISTTWLWVFTYLSSTSFFPMVPCIYMLVSILRHQIICKCLWRLAMNVSLCGFPPVAHEVFSMISLAQCYEKYKEFPPHIPTHVKRLTMRCFFEFHENAVSPKKNKMSIVL